MKRVCIGATASLILLTIAVPSLAASNNILPSTISVDSKRHTVVLPLYHGTVNGRSVWYVITDASDRATAERLRVVYAPALAKIGVEALQYATRRNGSLVFDGAPDFSPARTYVASANGFPPKSATPGGLADRNYSPFVVVKGERGVLNAPILATGDGPFDVTNHTNTEDRVLAIDTKAMRITLALVRGFVSGNLVDYISSDASDPTAATVERATYVPKLAKAGPSSTIPIGVVVDGPVNADNSQGLKYLALHTPLSRDATLATAAQIGTSFNILSLAPDAAHLYRENGYSPLWAVQVVGAPQHARVTSFGSFAALGAKPAGFLVNCPVIAFAH